MAEPIVFPGPKQLASLETGEPGHRTDAVGSAYALLQELHDAGVLDMLRGLVSARDEISGIATSVLNTPETIRALRNLLLLTTAFSSIQPEVLKSFAQALATGANRKSEHRAPSVTHLLWRMRDGNIRRVVAVMLDVLASLGKDFAARPVSAMTE